jgi:hypothetical protein
MAGAGASGLAKGVKAVGRKVMAPLGGAASAAQSRLGSITCSSCEASDSFREEAAGHETAATNLLEAVEDEMGTLRRGADVVIPSQQGTGGLHLRKSATAPATKSEP